MASLKLALSEKIAPRKSTPAEKKAPSNSPGTSLENTHLVGKINLAIEQLPNSTPRKSIPALGTTVGRHTLEPLRSAKVAATAVSSSAENGVNSSTECF